MNLDELKKPFPENRIHWRVGSTNKRKIQKETGNKDAKPTKGIPLAYIDARDVMERLDYVCGPENWQCRYPFAGCCEIGIKINGEWVWKSNGAGVTDVEAEKGQYSDAFKRAAVLWGIGQYLYDLPNVWVDLTGNNYDPFKEAPTLPQWATPNGWNRLPASQIRAVYEQTIDCIHNNDQAGLIEIWGEFTQEEQVQLWRNFNASQRDLIKKVKQGE
jgi:hypothetical protein